MKYSKEKKEEAKKIRLEEGLTYPQIAKRINVSEPTLKRWLKGVKFNGVPKVTSIIKKPEITSELKNKEDNEKTEDKEKVEVSKNNDTEEVLGDTQNEGMKTPSFKGIRTSFDTKTGSIMIEDAMGAIEIVKPEPNKSNQSDSTKGSELESPSEETVKPGTFIDKVKNVITPKTPETPTEPEKPDIDLIGVLLPVALLAGGVLMKGEADKAQGQTNNAGQGAAW